MRTLASVLACALAAAAAMLPSAAAAGTCPNGKAPVVLRMDDIQVCAGLPWLVWLG